MKQKEVFLSGEGNEWFRRNRDSSMDVLFPYLAPIFETYSNKEKLKVLEIGCGGGGRLKQISSAYGCQVYGIDPGNESVDNAASLGVKAQVGDASDLSCFEDSYFDVVIFGFCLYLCDREDLFKIASEANRVLKYDSWLVIFDFIVKGELQNNYVHAGGVKSYKMDYRQLFLWHPHYTEFLFQSGAHNDFIFTDDKNDQVGIAVLKKNIEN